jgi:hypothetical protein
MTGMTGMTGIWRRWTCEMRMVLVGGTDGNEFEGLGSGDGER